jgi:hypothetical protein
MPGGGQVRVIKPWNVAAETLLYSCACLGTLLVFFIAPEIVRAGMYLAFNAAERSGKIAWWWPAWTLNLASYAISAVVFTGIIRHVVLAEEPFWIPKLRPATNYLATAALLMVVAGAVDFITSSWLFVKLYRPFMEEGFYDERKVEMWAAAYSVVGFFLSAIFIAASYPALGFTAVHARIDVTMLLHWNRTGFWRFFALTLLLMSLCLVLRRAYWWTLDTLAPGLTSDIYYVDHENVRSMVVQVITVPVDMLFDIVPAVAIGLLYRVLRANSADL